ncbi:hypothetical protein [Rhizosaccharibacter radicis]|uniref:Protein kinase domain-containing protein n=1 Tax=Rhizosaccharibacter radicis TaxID=2782605 RepID=A0ABT1VZF8_9PROT|nr:hypothetical protein [Acetobacteraceae bacterium KSS12]
MARQQQETADGGILVGNHHRVLPSGASVAFAGLDAWPALPAVAGGEGDGRRLLAVRTLRHAPPSRSLPSFIELMHPTLLAPQAFGGASGHFWVVCEAPPGPSLAEQLAETGPWPEQMVSERLLKPVAQALQRLHMLGLTHRGIRLSNLFLGENGRLLLGPGCLAPPAFFQPARSESPYVGLCDPEARGAGIAADDVYALGVAALELFLGRELLAGLDDGAVVDRKFEQGSLAALAGDEALPLRLTGLLRGMLSHDPRARPTVDALAANGLQSVRIRATRLPAVASRPLQLGASTIRSAAELARHLSRDLEVGLAQIRHPAVTGWIRRGLEQPDLAHRLDELLAGSDARPDPATTARLLAMLDPLAPLFWQKRWLWPDALPGCLAIATSKPGQLAAALPLLELLSSGVTRSWGEAVDRAEPPRIEELRRRLDDRRMPRANADRLRILAYLANPYLACSSPRTAGVHVFEPVALLLFLDAQEAGGDAELLDDDMRALLLARMPFLMAIRETGTVRDIAVLAAVQAERNQKQLRGLAALLLPWAHVVLAEWPGAARRGARQALLQAAAEAGDLEAMLAAIRDETALEADRAAQAAAIATIAALKASREQLGTAGDGGPQMREMANDLAQGVAVLALMLSLVMRVLG